ncbi:hypothetical protein HY967_04240, partial [Candidatus Jorgensenbacteria bacterium]|nr:hypothetical protein [Candidatus Jorgensenbacteria bacterium]
MKKFNTKSSFLLVVAVIAAQLFFVSGSMVPFTQAEEADSSVVSSVDATTSPSDETVVAPSDDSTSVSTEENNVVDSPTTSAVEESTPSTESVTTDVPVDNTSTSDTSASNTTPSSATQTTVTVAPVLTTDKSDYHPGETVGFFGSLFQAVQNVVLRIFGGTVEDENYNDTSINLTTDEQGSFTYFHTLSDLFVPVYNAVVSTVSGEKLVETTFTDSLPTDFAQCSNDNSPNPAGSCNWIGSIIQQSNSVYAEGMTVPQRLLFR